MHVIYGNSAVQRAHGAFHRLGEGAGIALSSNRQTNERARLLILRNVHLLANFAGQVMHARMLYDTDHLGIAAVEPGTIKASEVHDLQPLSDGVLVGPGTIREKFIDHHDERMGQIVLLDEKPSVSQLYAHGFEV